MQIILLFTGVNMSFFIDTAGAYFVNPCGFGSPALSVFLFVLHISMLLLEAVTLLQTIRVTILIYSVGPFKSYTSISWVLHKMQWQNLFLDLTKALEVGDCKSIHRMAKQLHRKLDPDRTGVVSTITFHSVAAQRVMKHGLSEADLIYLLRQLDEDGDGFLEFADLFRELRRIFNA